MHIEDSAVKARAEYIAQRFPHLTSDATALATEWAEREEDETHDGSDAPSPRVLLRQAMQSLDAVGRYLGEGDTEWAAHLANVATVQLIRVAHGAAL